MRYALVKNGIVQNIIDYDPATITSAHEEYTFKQEEFKKLEKRHAKAVRRYNQDCQKLQVKAHKQLAEMKASEPDKRHSITIELPDAPIAPTRPKRPLCAYTPPLGYDLIKLADDDQCVIGGQYQNGKFKP